MPRLTQHLTRNFLAGLVALLPIAGLVLTIAYLESTVAQSWLVRLPFYFPGLGLLAAAALVYLIGVIVSTVVGKWLWSRIDGLFDSAPALGPMYQTLKQVLGYGHGKEAVFRQAVLLPGSNPEAEEIGLVTNEIAQPDGTRKLLIFIPGVPNPTSGRLLLMDSRRVRPLDVPVNQVLKHLVSLGKIPIDAAADQG